MVRRSVFALLVVLAPFGGAQDLTVCPSELGQNWRGVATIVVVPGDFPEAGQTSDHRPVVATFNLAGVGPEMWSLKAQILVGIAAMEAELAALRAFVEQIGE